jgi:hypothetical protein
LEIPVTANLPEAVTIAKKAPRALKANPPGPEKPDADSESVICKNSSRFKIQNSPPGIKRIITKRHFFEEENIHLDQQYVKPFPRHTPNQKS